MERERSASGFSLHQRFGFANHRSSSPPSSMEDYSSTQGFATQTSKMQIWKILPYGSHCLRMMWVWVKLGSLRLRESSTFKAVNASANAGRCNWLCNNHFWRLQHFHYFQTSRDWRLPLKFRLASTAFAPRRKSKKRNR